MTVFYHSTKGMKHLILSFFCLMIVVVPVRAQDSDPFKSTPYDIPRFVTIAKDKAYMRTGPGSRFPITWIYKRKNLPVEIVLEYENWRKIKDIDGSEGWVHLSLLSGRRYGAIQADDMMKLHSKPSNESRVMAFLEPETIVKILSCGPQWCRIDAQGYKGWMPKASIWGVYADEIIEN